MTRQTIALTSHPAPPSRLVRRATQTTKMTRRTAEAAAEKDLPRSLTSLHLISIRPFQCSRPHRTDPIQMLFPTLYSPRVIVRSS